MLNLMDERAVWAPPPGTLGSIAGSFGKGWEVLVLRAPVTGRGDGGGGSDEMIGAARGAEVLIGFGLPRDVLLAALEPPARLRWIHSGSAGVASLLHPELVESDIVLTNSAGIHGPPIAETVLAMVLHFARGLDYAVRAQAESRWDPIPWETPGTAREIAGATLGIVGLGGLGREIATRALALGMRVLAIRRSDRPAPEGIELLRGDDALDTLLARSDFVVLTVPATPETRGMIGAGQLERMRPDAVLINVARGGLIDEDALAATLANGRLRGAALDVTATEPLPASSPLWKLPNVLIMPHVSPTTTRFWEREEALITENVRRYLDGRELRNVVDKRAGY